MKYSYVTFLPGVHSKENIIKRPMIEIEIFGPKGSHKQFALIDSGADRSLFNMEIAKVIGLDLSNGGEYGVTGISGVTKAIILEVEIKVAHLNKIIIPVGFIDSPYVGVLLGQEGFFDKNKIKFEKDHDTFEINPVFKK
jgi:hypothetical protein